jgi:hypothetical protein
MVGGRIRRCRGIGRGAGQLVSVLGHPDHRDVGSARSLDGLVVYADADLILQEVLTRRLCLSSLPLGIRRWSPTGCRPGPPVTATAPYELSVRCANGDVKLQVEHLALSNGRSAFNSVEGPTSAKVKLIMAKCGERACLPLRALRSARRHREE